LGAANGLSDIRFRHPVQRVLLQCLMALESFSTLIATILCLSSHDSRIPKKQDVGDDPGRMFSFDRFDRSSSFNGTIPWPLRLPQFTPERGFPQTCFHDFHVASAVDQLARLRHNATLMYAYGGFLHRIGVWVAVGYHTSYLRLTAKVGWRQPPQTYTNRDAMFMRCNRLY
jgi:hypothetical protein